MHENDARFFAVIMVNDPPQLTGQRHDTSHARQSRPLTTQFNDSLANQLRITLYNMFQLYC